MSVRSVLALRTFWYPENGPGTRRFASFCRGLNNAGYEVTLLALSNPNPFFDSSTSNDACESGHAVLLPHRVQPNSIRYRIERKLVHPLFPQFRYNRKANRLVQEKASELLQKKSFGAILTTYGPLGSLAIAEKLSRGFDVPWVADLRDLPDQFDEERKNWAVRREAEMLGMCCAKAAHVLTVSEPLKARLEQDYGLRVPISVVYNGYESPPWSPKEEETPSPEFPISYFGTIYAGRSPELLFAGLELLRNAGVSLDGVSVRFFGRSGYVAPAECSKKSHELIQNWGMLEPKKALEVQRESAVLLSLASPGAKGVLTSKIFEYAMAGRPVLSIPADDNGLDDFVHRSGVGYVCDTPAHVASRLAPLLKKWRETGYLPGVSPDLDYLQAFSRDAQAKKVCEVMTTLI